ncbi:MAG: response regulator [Clostridia bacterium]|nr:response regulator [Clostridia bacterium]
MENTYILLALVFVVILIISVCYIYQSSKSKKQKSEKIDKEYAEYEKRQRDLEIKERQEKSIRWNENIQEKFDGKIKYKTNRPIKALIGDYTDSMAPYTNSMLRRMGIETEVVPTASDVIDRVNTGNQYDIIITNNVYPKGESGQQVLDTLKEDIDFKIPIVILTVDQNARNIYLDKGFDEYIEKPISEEKIKKIFPELINDLEFIKTKKQ